MGNTGQPVRAVGSDGYELGAPPRRPRSSQTSLLLELSGKGHEGTFLVEHSTETYCHHDKLNTTREKVCFYLIPVVGSLTRLVLGGKVDVQQDSPSLYCLCTKHTNWPPFPPRPSNLPIILGLRRTSQCKEC